MTIPHGARAIGLDELPVHTHWISYLTGLEALPRSLDKTSESLLREYGQDKWGALLGKLKHIQGATIADADRLIAAGSKATPFYVAGGLYVADFEVVQRAYFELIQNALRPHVEESGHLVELGAGYGSLILKLASLPGFEKAGLTAGEYTATGVTCIDLLASGQNGLQSGHCDLSDLNLRTFTIPDGAVFFTSWTMACLKGFSRNTLMEIIRHRPAAVIHIEPIYEYWTDESLLQMLWKRYCQLNDYNRSMLTALKQYESEGLIKIIEEGRNVFGSNPLAPVSIVTWIPHG